MKLDNLLDDWDDLTIDLYLREKMILSKYSTIKLSHKKNLNKMLALGDHVPASRRLFCKLLAMGMNMSVFSDEAVNVRFFDKNQIVLSETVFYYESPENFMKEIDNSTPINAVYLQFKINFKTKRNVFEQRLSLISKDYFEKRIKAVLDEENVMYYSPLFYKLYDRLEKKRNLYILDLFMSLYSDLHQRKDGEINNRQDSLDTVINMSQYDNEVLDQYKFAIRSWLTMMNDLKLKEEFFSMLELNQD